MKRKYWKSYIIFVMFFIFSQLSGCGCENTYALRASKKELKETSKLLDEITDKVDDLSFNLNNLTQAKMYDSKRDIEKKINKIKLILYWSKNIDLVLDNEWIISELKSQKARLKDLEKDFNTLKMNFAKKIRKNFKPIVEPNNQDSNYSDDNNYDDNQDDNYSNDDQNDDNYYNDTENNDDDYSNDSEKNDASQDDNGDYYNEQ